MTSLPGPFSSGDIGGARAFIDWLAEAGQGLWQILPLNPPEEGGSPYKAASAFAANEALIDLAWLVSRGWLLASELPVSRGKDVPDAERFVDFVNSTRKRLDCLKKAADRFQASASTDERTALHRFCETHRAWLDDYALFMAIADERGSPDWTGWPATLRDRDPSALAAAREASAQAVFQRRFSQWVFHTQWQALRAHAHANGIRLIGDVPIFVAQHSADVWAHRDLFDLQPDGAPRVVAGVPPDAFSETGQRWGNPLYRWDVHAKDGYAWWTARLSHVLEYVDVVRIDHFRAFAAHWEIDASAPDAIAGQWVTGPGTTPFDAARKSLGELPFIAEDLGYITQDVHQLRDRLGLPGMRVLQFAFDEGADCEHLPHHHRANSVVYTGTHDNDTARGWWDAASPEARAYAAKYLRTTDQQVHWDLIGAAWGSVGHLAICQLQDVLGSNSAHRMNRPGSAQDNWRWRCLAGELERSHATRLRELSATFGRLSIISERQPPATRP